MLTGLAILGEIALLGHDSWSAWVLDLRLGVSLFAIVPFLLVSALMALTEYARTQPKAPDWVTALVILFRQWTRWLMLNFWKASLYAFGVSGPLAALPWIYSPEAAKQLHIGFYLTALLFLALFVFGWSSRAFALTQRFSKLIPLMVAAIGGTAVIYIAMHYWIPGLQEGKAGLSEQLTTAIEILMMATWLVLAVFIVMVQVPRRT